MDDEFLATAYPKVHENLKLITDERVIEDNPESHSGSMSSMKNLEDTDNFGDQFLYDKPTEDDQEKSKVVGESDSTIPDPSHQTVTTNPPVIAPVTEFSSPKPSSLVTPPPINTEATTITTSLPEITPFIALQLRVARLEQEMSEIKKTDHSADVLASIKSQVPTVVDKYLGTKLDDALLRTLERHTADLIEKYSELPGPESVKNQASEMSPTEIMRIKREQGEEKQKSTYSIRSTDKVALEEFDLKSALFKHMNKNKTANRNPANYHLYHALMEALIADEDAMDKEVALKVKDHKRKHDSDDDEDDDDDEGPSAGSNQGRSAKRRRPDSAASESAQPPPKDDDQSSKKPRESDASASKQHPALTSTGWQITDTRDDVVNSSMPRSDTESEHSEQSSDDIPMQDEGHVSDLEDTDNAHIPKVSTTTWFKPIPEGERPATPEPEWTIPPNDFPEPENNWANTYATTYQVPAENKLQRKTYDIGSFIKWFCRRTGKKKLCKADLEEFDLKSALFKHMNKNRNANRNPANYHLYHAFMEALIADEDVIDKEVKDRVKNYKRKHDSDDDEDDDDDEGPSARSNQGKSTKKRRHDSGASGSAQPPPKDDEQSLKKPKDYDASASKQHPTLTSTGWQITDTRDAVIDSSMYISEPESGHSKHSYYDVSKQDEGHVSDLEDTDNAHIPKVTAATWFKPIPEDERLPTPEPEWTIPPNDFPEPENNWANAYATTYQVPAKNKLQRKTYDIGDKERKTALSISKLKAARYLDFGLEELVPSLWVESERDYDISAAYDREAVRSQMRILSVIRVKTFEKYGYNYLREIILRRADYKEYKISEKDFKNLHPNDFEDLYLLNIQDKLNHLSKSDKIHLHTAVNMWIRNLVIRNRMGDLQLGIESYQTKLNLERPNWDATDYSFKEDYTIVPKPRAVIYRDRNDQRKLMRLNEIHKFSDGTLTRVMEKLDHMVKDFYLYEYNKGMETRKWSEDDKRRSKDFITVIEKRLQIRRIFQSLESFVGGRIRDIDYRLISRTT
ncbi:hypothetical protein Tco_1446362 [Tanacetum coccineum]